ncbi:cytochrome P450 81Q32-like [Benincasa hispida]|uniref:cytochrome P450 81Q32-like n=1 Tax=Benincasa hispida TaxID=102211 RepID=UPI0018FF785C|nr:cytochrome P450 81Q32-like [Benincasa hispida]
METTTYFPVLITFLALISIFLFQNRKHTTKTNLPPSPLALPILGHLHLLKHPIHRTLHSLAQNHGPIFTLRLGSRPVVVVSSTSAVEECFTTNDIVFANRPQFVSGKYLSYGNTTLGAAPYGDHWRNLRRLSATEVLSSIRLNMSAGIRKEEIKILLRKLYKVSGTEYGKVKLKTPFSELTFNMIMRMVAGKRYYGEEVSELEEAKKFREIMQKSFQLGSYPGDFLPFLKWVDWQYAKRLENLGKDMDLFLQNLVDEHRRNQGDGKQGNTMISHILCLQKTQPDYYTDEIIKGLIVTILSAATETSSATIEWAMSNLLNHPEVLNKAKNELDKQIGQDRLLDEEDICNLPYLQNVISETLRLYPPAPLLAPHFSSSSCCLGGYHIPANTMLMVNAWTIQRDPKVWEDSTSFKPERFESEGGGSSNNNGYGFLPFGLGRRACPGMGMANRVVGLTLGSLIQSFEWKRVSEKEIDMTEGQGISMPKVEPLEALCRARPIMKNLALD